MDDVMNFLFRAAENALERMLFEQFWQLWPSMDFRKYKSGICDNIVLPDTFDGRIFSICFKKRVFQPSKILANEHWT